MGTPTGILRVPIRVDGLYVGSDGQKVTLPMADFSRLPYNLSDGSTVNTQPPTPNLAKVAFNSPLGSGDSLSVPSGLHLHWALPDALTVGHNLSGTTQFPAVPNRWLVRRLDGAGSLQKAWVVESDYLHPLDPTTSMPVSLSPITAWPGGHPITFPTKRLQLPNDKPGAAFRYMGRSLLLSDWLSEDSSSSEYLNQTEDSSIKYKYSEFPLTAIGFGEPAFAAYYPNCYSVFGFCDNDKSLDPNGTYEYQIIGWYNEPSLDPLQSSHFAGFSSDAERYDALESEYGWVVADADRQEAFPQSIVCYASLGLSPHDAGPWSSGGDVDISIANTGGEALAALLADKAASGQNRDALKRQIEDQLEAVNLAPALQGVQVDYQAHLARLRHERGFVGAGGGSSWAVLPKRDVQPDLAADLAAEALQPPLPDAVAQALDRLNTAQEAYDSLWQEITELRYQTFCDWHKFLVAYYSDRGDLQHFREHSGDIVDYIESSDLALLDAKLDLTGTLTTDGSTWHAQGSSTVTLDLSTNTLTPATPANTTLAAQILLQLKALLDALSTADLMDQFNVVSRSADSFWRPREPVVLLTSDVAVSTPRHGEDGDLPCGVLGVEDAPGTVTFVDAADALKPSSDDPGLQTQDASPWHPILLEWSVQLDEVIEGRQADPTINDTLDFEPTFLTRSFALQENAPDLSTSGSPQIAKSPDTYEGRCVITPTAGEQLKGNLSAYLARATLYDARDPAAGPDAGYFNRLVAWFQVRYPAASPGPDKAVWSQSQKLFEVSEYDADALQSILAWYQNKPLAGENNTIGTSTPEQQANDPVYSAIRALSNLQGLNVLSQALGGFNAALMVREQMLQIPIEDPLGIDQLQIFQDITTHVAQAVGVDHPYAPLDLKVFDPIRSGRLTLTGLSLIDTFGQKWNAPQEVQPVISNSLSNTNQAGALFLPPRYAAPVRLNFRWLAGRSNDGDEIEMNSVPATTPIVGWLVPDNLESSLMVYDDTGQALGSINTLAEWNPAPASSGRIAAADIPNPYLRRLVRRLVVDVGTPAGEITLRQHFLQGLISTVDSALEAIEPASFAQHEALALLMARPIAVVRAQVDLQIMGQPLETSTASDSTITVQKAAHWKSFADQNWDVFAFDWGRFYGCSYEEVTRGDCPFLQVPQSPDEHLEQYARSTHGFEKVVVPLRIGEHQLLNDGVVGFWTETPDGDLDNVFHAPQTLEGLDIPQHVVYEQGIASPAIRAYTEGQTDNLSLTLQDDPLSLTLLIDPRGVVHATSGLLPVRSLEIPPVYYADALKRMGVTFRVGPLLTDSEQLNAAVPKEPGYVWSWVTKPDGSTWEETGDITEATEQAQFFKPPALVDGWFKLTPSDTNEG